MISLSPIADLLAPSYSDHLVGRRGHESRRGAVGASGASNRKDSTPRCDQEIVALRDFNSPMSALGHSRPSQFRPMSASPRKQTFEAGLATVREIWSSGLQQDQAMSARGSALRQ